MNTNRWMQEVNARFPVRKSKVQKAQFRQYVLQKAQEMGYAARMEENKAICTNRNIVVGDVDKAKVLVTAHYDTPATVGLPNVMLPMNRPMFYLVQALIALGYQSAEAAKAIRALEGKADRVEDLVLLALRRLDGRAK